MAKKQHVAFSDYTIRDFYKYYVKNGGKVCYDIYSDIVNDINESLGNEIAVNGVSFTIPCGLGQIEWRKYKKTIDVNNFDESLDKLPVDRYATRKLWNEDRKYCEDNKIVVRHLNDVTDRYVFQLVYFKSKFKYRNRGVYQMKIRQYIKRKSVESIRNRDFDAFVDDMMFRIKNRILNKKKYAEHNIN